MKVKVKQKHFKKRLDRVYYHLARICKPEPKKKKYFTLGSFQLSRR